MRRRRTASQPSIPSAVKLTFGKFATANVLKLEEDDGTRRFEGAFVRYAPRLRKRERDAFSAREAERSLIARGARVAVASLVLVPDEVEVQRMTVSSVDAREHVRAWFGTNDGADEALACERALVILDEVGF